MVFGETHRPKMRVFKCQSHVIQCILIVMKLSPIGLVQKSVMKAMSVCLASCSISLLISSRNSLLLHSNNLVMLCFDMLGHRGSHFLMNFINPGWVLICKGKFSSMHSRGRFIMQHFLSALPRPYSSLHSFNVLCPCNWVSTPRNLAFLSSKSSQ